ncbi:MAG: hypothetical protein ACRDP7_38620 [Trebonia sp.]
MPAVRGVVGTVNGLADRIWRDNHQRLLTRAVALSVIAWVIGMGFRFWFAYYANHGGGPAVARFAAQHDLSGADIWTTALVVMAFGQVLARLAILQIRRARAISHPGTPQVRPAAALGTDASLAAR